MEFFDFLIVANNEALEFAKSFILFFLFLFVKNKKLIFFLEYLNLLEINSILTIASVMYDYFNNVKIYELFETHLEVVTKFFFKLNLLIDNKSISKFKLHDMYEFSKGFFLFNFIKIFNLL